MSQSKWSLRVPGREIFLVSFFAICSLTTVAQQSLITGVVSIQNSETRTGHKVFVTNAQVEDDFSKAQPYVTRDHGQFELIYVKVDDNTSVSFHITKKGLEVVNLASLNAVTGQRDSVRIAMATPDSIAEYRREIYKVGKTEAEQKLESQMVNKNKELSELRKNGKQNAGRIKQLEQDLSLLEDQKKQIEMQAQELARKYAPVNLDDALPMFRDAFRLFQNGKLDSALLLFDSANLPGKVDQVLIERGKIVALDAEVKKRDSAQSQTTKDLIKIISFRADLDKTAFRFDETAANYELLLKLDSANADVLFNYAEFLLWRNQIDQALIYFKKTLEADSVLFKSNPRAYETSKVNILINMGILYSEKNDLPRAEATLLEALEISKKLNTGSLRSYKPLAIIQINLGSVYTKYDSFSKAESAYLDAFGIYTNLSKQDTLTYQSDLALVLNDLGVLYRSKNNYDKAAPALLQALGIRERLVKNNPQDLGYAADLASLKSNLGALYMDQNQFDSAEKHFEGALEIRERLVKISPESYEPSLADIKNNLGVLYKKHRNYHKAEKLLLESIAIYSKWAEWNPNTYVYNYASTQLNLGNLYLEKGDSITAEKSYIQGLANIKKFANDNPVIYQRSVADITYSLGSFYLDRNDLIRADSLLNETLKIRNRLAIDNPDVYEPALAETLLEMGVLYRNEEKFKLAEQQINKAIIIYRKFNQNNPQLYGPNLASTLNNLGNHYSEHNELSKAETPYFEALRILQSFALYNPTVYNPDVARTENNLGILYGRAMKYDLAEKYLDSALQIRANGMKTNPEAYYLKYTTNTLDLYKLYTIVLDSSKSYHDKIVIQLKKIELCKNLSNLYRNDKYTTLEYAKDYGELSWYLLMTKQFEEARKSALKGLEIDSAQIWIKVNLAHAYLLSGRYNSAMELYQQLKFTDNPQGKTFYSICLDNLDSLESAGISNKDFARVREYLRK